MAHEQERPKVAFVLLLIGGIFTLLGGLFGLSVSLFAVSLLSAAGFGAFVGFGTLGIATGTLGVVCGALMIVAAVRINSTDANQIRIWSVIGFVFTLFVMSLYFSQRWAIGFPQL